MCVYNHHKDRSANRMYGWLKERFSKSMSISQSGKNSSQYGTMWIYNLDLKKSRKIPKTNIVPDGWKKGRVIDFDKYEDKLKKVASQLQKRQVCFNLFYIRILIL